MAERTPKQSTVDQALTKFLCKMDAQGVKAVRAYVQKINGQFEGRATMSDGNQYALRIVDGKMIAVVLSTGAPRSVQNHRFDSPMPFASVPTSKPGFFINLDMRRRRS